MPPPDVLTPLSPSPPGTTASLDVCPASPLSEQLPLTAQELLAILPNTAPACVAGLSGVSGAAIRPAPAHTSSKCNHNYESIPQTSLVRVAGEEITRFRTFLKSMSKSVLFDSVMKLPFDASTITTEGDVTAYLQSQVIMAAWQAVLEMVPPTKREYDLLTVRQFYLEVF